MATEQFIAPAATVLENTDGYTLEVEMPGVSKENLEMWVENNDLTILGRRSMPSSTGNHARKISGARLSSIRRSTRAKSARKSNKASSL
jgi:HSP20 family molecular chaperone IbpA